jgi:hypothetical protein
LRLRRPQSQYSLLWEPQLYWYVALSYEMLKAIQSTDIEINIFIHLILVQILCLLWHYIHLTYITPCHLSGLIYHDAFTNSGHWTQYSQSVSWRSILVLSSHHLIGLQSQLPTKSLCALHVCSFRLRV